MNLFDDTEHTSSAPEETTTSTPTQAFNVFDNNYEEADTFIGNEGLYALDADTFGIAGSNERFRLEGVDAREVEKIVGGKYKFGQHGGKAQTSTIVGLANQYGFTKVRNTGRKDVHGREIADLVNENGESFTDKLLYEGVLGTTRFSDTEQVKTKQAGQLADLFRDQKLRQGDASGVSTWDVASADLQAFINQEGINRKLAPLNEAEFAEAQRQADELGLDNPFSAQRIQFRHGDRDIFNVAYSPLSQGWDTGWGSIAEGWDGVRQLVGSKLGIETPGADTDLAKAQFQSLFQADTTDQLSELESVGDVWDFTKYLAGSSVPYILSHIGGKVAGGVAGAGVGFVTAGPVGAVVGAGIGSTYGGFAVSSAIYAGQAWNDQEGELDSRYASIALGSGVIQGALDSLGYGLIAGSSKSKLVNSAISKVTSSRGKATFSAVAKHIAKNKSVSIEDASKLLLDDITKSYAASNGMGIAQAAAILGKASKEQIAGLAGDIAGFARSQITAGNALKDTIKAASLGGVSEGLTEAAQETVGYGSTILASEGRKVWDWDEYNNRVATGLIGGGLLGGSLGSFGGGRNALEWGELAYKKDVFDTSRATSEAQAHNVVVDTLGVSTVNEGITYAENLKPSVDAFDAEPLSFDDRKKAYEASQDERGVISRIFDVFKTGDTNRAFEVIRSEAASAIPNSIIAKSPQAAIIASLFGGRKAGILAGDNAETNTRHKATTLLGLASEEGTAVKSVFGRDTSANREKFYKLYQEVSSVIDGKIDRENISPEAQQHFNSIKRVYDNFEAGYQAEYDVKSDNARLRGDKALGYERNYAARHRAIDKGQVEKNQSRVEADLQTYKGKSAAEAKEIVDKMLHDPNFDGDFTQLQGNRPGSTRNRTLRLSEAKRPDGSLAFDYILDSNPWSNYKKAVSSSVNQNTILNYFGKDGKNIAALLNEGVNQGNLSEAEANRIAWYSNNIIDIMNGNYHPVKSPTLKWVTRNTSALFNVLYGPLFIFASMAELANVAAGVKAYDKSYSDSLKEIAKSGATELAQELKKINAPAIETQPQTPLFAASSRQRIEDLGYTSQEISQATVTGVVDDDSNKVRKQVSEYVFKYSGLSKFTEITRAMRAAIFDDFFWANAQILADHKQGQPWLNEHQDALNSLLEVGVDGKAVADRIRSGELDVANLDSITSDSEVGQFLDNQFRAGLSQWIDMAIPNPGAANRPAIYNNPHMRLFLMYQGFISTFTSVHLPKMYQRFRHQGPQMTMNVFSQVTALVLLAYLAQALKDEMLYLDEEDNPLGEGQKVYRAVRKTGLLGTSERVLDWFFPLFEDKTKGLEGLTKDILGELGTTGQAVYNVGKGVSQVAGGEEVPQGLNNLLRQGPVTAVSTPLRHKLISVLTGQPFGTAESSIKR